MPRNKRFYLLAIAEGQLCVCGIGGERNYREGQIYVSEIAAPATGTVRTFSNGKSAAVCIEILVSDLVPLISELDGGLVAGILAGEPFPGADGVFACILSLLSFTDNSLRSRFMAEHTKRVLVFALLTGGYGRILVNSIINCANADRIIQANTWIRNNFRSIFSIDEPAASINMTLSLFHQKFR